MRCPRLAVMVPWGVHTCTGRNCAELFNPEVASGFLCLTCLWPLGLTDCSLITDHQAQWTINLKLEPTPSRTTTAAASFYSNRTSLLMFSMSRLLLETGRRFSCLGCRFRLRLELKKKRERRKQTELVMENSRNCPNEKWEVNEIQPAQLCPSIQYVNIFDWGELQAHICRPPLPPPAGNCLPLSR